MLKINPLSLQNTKIISVVATGDNSVVWKLYLSQAQPEHRVSIQSVLRADDVLAPLLCMYTDQVWKDRRGRIQAVLDSGFRVTYMNDVFAKITQMSPKL